MRILHFSLILLFLNFSSAAWANESNGSESWWNDLITGKYSDPETFKKLNREKREQEEKIDYIDSEITKNLLRLAQLPKADQIESRLQMLRRDKERNDQEIIQMKDRIAQANKSKENKTKQLNILNAKETIEPDDEDKMLDLQYQLTDIEDDLYYYNQQLIDIPRQTEYITEDAARLNQQNEERKSLTNEVDELKSELPALKKAVREKDEEIVELLNRDNLRSDFRLDISKLFIMLVGLVIIGFYFIAFFKSDVAENIFSGEKGIQFITLFLIIISIILFGIMETLGSRELSALLGALSGYILGKTTHSGDKGSDNKNSGNENSNPPPEKPASLPTPPAAA